MYDREHPLSTTKVNPKFAPHEQHVRDRRWTLVGTVVASIFEICAVHLWSTGHAQFYTSMVSVRAFVRTALLWLVTAFISDLHFWIVHRLMHPWGVRLPFLDVDIGEVVYNNVHYFHHVSNNPGPWAGLAMHPVEHVLYFSRSLWLLCVSVHPVIFLFSNLRATIGPAPGHHGFADIFGSVFHIVHHQKYRCNYGTRGFIDQYMGTYVAAADSKTKNI